MGIEQRKKFDAEEFVDFLLGEGADVPYDQSAESANETTLPQFYDKELYRRGQLVYENHKFAVNFAMLIGIVAGLAVSFFRNILMFTGRSSTPSAARRRYIMTIAHVNSWYQNDFTTNLQLWKSIGAVRSRHISTNAQLRKAGKPLISQREMGLTLCGFIGYALMKRQKLGFYNVPDEDWKALIHVWRVIGHLMGVEDRFNICRESVEETTAICNEIEKKIVAPFANESCKDYISMTSSFSTGFILPIAPFLTTNTLLAFLCKLSGENRNNRIINIPVTLTLWDRVELLFMTLLFASMRFAFIRHFLNNQVSDLLTKFSKLLKT